MPGSRTRGAQIRTWICCFRYGRLVVYDDDGQPFSVRYHLLAPLLLNEVQKQEQRDGEHLRRIEEQQQTIETLIENNAVLVARLDALESGSWASR